MGCNMSSSKHPKNLDPNKINFHSFHIQRGMEYLLHIFILQYFYINIYVELGQGGFGKVKSVTNHVTKKWYAMKVKQYSNLN